MYNQMCRIIHTKKNENIIHLIFNLYMSCYIILDDIDITKSYQTVRIIKKYNITLLNIFPEVLDDMIKEYVNDILTIHIKMHTVCDTHTITINDQYINYEPITCKFDIYKFNTCCTHYFKLHNLNNNIADIISASSDVVLPYLLCSNKYMYDMHEISDYFDTNMLIQKYYMKGYKQASYNNNMLQYDKLTLKINNHKLFKNCLVCIKTILNAFNKKLI